MGHNASFLWLNGINKGDVVNGTQPQQTRRTYTIRLESELPFVEFPLCAGDLVEHALTDYYYRLLLIATTGSGPTGMFHRVKANGEIDRRCKPFSDYMAGYARH